MPTCSPPKRMGSPGAGAAEAGSSLPVLEAQLAISETEPSPCPFGPSGVPACAAAHDAKYAHQGWPGCAPATAERYVAICGPSFDPGGCSVTPTWLSAAATTELPDDVDAAANTFANDVVGAAGGEPACVAIIDSIAATRE